MHAPVLINQVLVAQPKEATLILSDFNSLTCLTRAIACEEIHIALLEPVLASCTPIPSDKINH
jgi:hypothetical protein